VASGNRPVLVRIAGDTTLFKKSIKGVKGSLSGLSKTAKLAGAGIVAGIGGATVGILKMGSTFEEVERTLRVGTGATGDALEGLKDITKNLAKTVPADFKDIGTAVADINTRLGLTGKDLESFSEQMLNLSRITGTDLQGNIKTATRVLGDWGDMAGTAESAADTLFTVAQMTGIEFSKLSNDLVTYGAPLRQVGFTFEESALMIGKFEKEGVNAELVLGSLRQALGKMAREGEPAIETFRRTTAEIKNAGDASTANRLALELFGARAGPDMAAAIREGRFELDEYFESLNTGGDTINAAAKETETLSERMSLLKNRVMMTLAPVVERAFEAITNAFRRLEPVVQDLVQRVKDFTETERFQEIKRIATEAIETIKNAISKITEKFREFIKENPKAAFAALAVVIGTVLLGAVIAVVGALGALLSPVVLVVGALAGLAAGAVYLYERFDIVKDTVDGFASFFKDVVYPIIKTTAGLLVDAFEVWFTVVKTVISGIKALFELDLKDALSNMVTAIPGMLNSLFSTIMDVIKGIGKRIAGWIIDGIKATISSIDLGDIFGGILDGVGGILGKIPKLWSGSRRTSYSRDYAGGGPSAPLGGIASQLDLSRGSMDWFQNPETIMHFQKNGLMDVFSALQAHGNVRGLSDAVHMGQGTGGFSQMTPDQIRVNINVEGSLIGSMPADVIEEVRVGLIEAQNSGKQLVVAQ
jgi:phage-related minor tail protein